MEIKRLTEDEIAQIYKTHMKRDFPPSELKPLGHIIKSAREGYGFSLGIYEEESLTGYAVFILCEETKCALLDYFAILKDRRGEGIGHRAFPLFEAYFQENLKEIEGLYIESERVSAAKNEKQRLTRERRISFYRSCGCEITKLRSILFDVDYSVLYKHFGKTGSGTSKEALDALYRKMFKPGHYAKFVSLTEEADSQHENSVSN